METAMKIIGMIGYLILCLAGAAMCVAVAAACIDKVLDKLYQLAFQKERERLRQQMHRDALWFSEDERTHLLLQNYAEHRIAVFRTIDDIRREWRNYKAKTTNGG